MGKLSTKNAVMFDKNPDVDQSEGGTKSIVSMIPLVREAITSRSWCRASNCSWMNCLDGAE